MRGYTQLTKALAISQLREPVGFFFLVIFSPALLLFLGFIFGNKPAPEFGGKGPIDNMVPGLMIMSLLIIGTSVVPQTLVLLRTSGAVNRLRMTPLSATTFMAADMTVNAVLSAIGPVLTLLIAVTVFGVSLPSNVVAFIGVIILGMVAFLAVGYALAAILPSVGAATGVGNLLMILLMLTSGAFVPVALLADNIQRAFHASPAYHLAQLVDQAWRGQSLSWISLAVLASVTVACATLALLLARRK